MCSNEANNELIMSYTTVMFYDDISSLRGTSYWQPAAAAAEGRRQKGCCKVAAVGAGGPLPVAVTGTKDPFGDHTAARRLPTTVPNDDTMPD